MSKAEAVAWRIFDEYNLDVTIHFGGRIREALAVAYTQGQQDGQPRTLQDYEGYDGPHEHCVNCTRCLFGEDEVEVAYADRYSHAGECPAHREGGE